MFDCEDVSRFAGGARVLTIQRPLELSEVSDSTGEGEAKVGKVEGE